MSNLIMADEIWPAITDFLKYKNDGLDAKQRQHIWNLALNWDKKRNPVLSLHVCGLCLHFLSKTLSKTWTEPNFLILAFRLVLIFVCFCSSWLQVRP